MGQTYSTISTTNHFGKIMPVDRNQRRRSMITMLHMNTASGAVGGDSGPLKALGEPRGASPRHCLSVRLRPSTNRQWWCTKSRGRGVCVLIRGILATPHLALLLIGASRAWGTNLHRMHTIIGEALEMRMPVVVPWGWTTFQKKTFSFRANAARIRVTL
jgi:hypothetical protein